MAIAMIFKRTFISVQVFMFYLDLKCSQSQDKAICRFPLCCDENKLDTKTNQCGACLSGYYGPNCTLPCRFPNYGPECQSECDCDKQQCNHTIGCRKKEIASNDSIFYQSYVNEFLIEENHSPSSFWDGLDLKHKAMLISVCIIGALLVAMFGIFIFKKMKKYLHMTSFKLERNPSVTSSLL
uniref:Uncharacterized protein n=1 Tax=Magallana gigas TaxID=29159 RepID=A0A8W8JCT1_MAGGI|nr:uncharacterized protein LOC105328248 [Crassostrea gigas]